MTPRQAMARLRREGFDERPGKGSHRVFTHADGRRTIIADHPGDIPTPTLRKVCKQVGWEYPPQR